MGSVPLPLEVSRMMPSPSPLQSYAGGGAIKKGLKAATRAAPPPQELDPLSAIIAARMAGQLEAIPQALPELSPLQRMNLPAAYAGDQRSLQAVQRGINEAETGLASPGRRKFVKQAAATAARSAIPDSISSALGTTALKKALTDAVTPPAIPDESIQAAYAAAFGRALKNKTLHEITDHGVSLQELFDNPDFYVDSIGFAPAKIQSVRAALESLSPANLAKQFGIPEEAVTQYLSKVGMDPKEVLRDWLGERNLSEDFIDSTRKRKFYDYISPLTPEDQSELAKMLAERYRGSQGSDLKDLDPDELIEGLYDGIHDAVSKKHVQESTNGYQKFFGPQQFEKLRRIPGISDPQGLALDRMDTLFDVGGPYYDYVDETVAQLRKLLGVEP